MKELEAFNQNHLVDDFKKFSLDEKRKAERQIQTITWVDFLEQQRTLEKPFVETSFSPLKETTYQGSQEFFELGEKILKEGKVACIILAGGQATRLGEQTPKGSFPISVVKKKSLFQIFAEKIRALQKKLNCKLPLAIMTSPNNHKKTVEFFTKHDFFGLDISFFSQTMLPLLKENGSWFWEKAGQLAMGPKGNGEVFNQFHKSGLFASFRKKGIEYVTIIQVDNALAKPFDEELIGFHHQSKNQVSIKCIERGVEENQSGLLVVKNGKIHIQEYFLLPKGFFRSREAAQYKYTSVGNFCISMDFIEKYIRKRKKLPLKVSRKNYQEFGHKINILKFESFVFDAFAYADPIKALCFPSKSCYSPLKKPEQIKEVQKLLNDFDCEIISKMTGKKINRAPFELAMDFHFPTADLINYWKGRNPKGNYIEPFEK